MKKLLTVDYSIKPSLIPLEVKEHPTRTDTVQIDVSKIKLALTLKKGESYISGDENIMRFKKEKGILLDVRIMEELLKHQEFIPQEWEKKYVFFFGTIFAGPGGNLFAACLYRYGLQWHGDWRWLDSGWDALDPAARLASIGTGKTRNIKTLVSFDPSHLESRILELERFKSRVEKIIKL